MPTRKMARHHLSGIHYSMRQREKQKKRKKAGIRRANAVFLKSYYSRNKKTLFQACKAVLFGSFFIAAGLAMTILGYFHIQLATSLVQYNTTTTLPINSSTDSPNISFVSEINDTKRVIFKGMQYVGPVCMGFGAFAMIIACVMTLESRDRHAQIIQEESSEYRKLNKSKSDTEGTKTSLLSPFDENVEIIDEVSKGNNNNNNGSTKKKGEKGKVETPPDPFPTPNGHPSLSSSEKCSSLPLASSSSSPPHYDPIYRPTTLSAASSASPIELSVHRFLNINIRKPRGPAPIAEADSFLDLSVQTTPNGYPSTSQKRSSVRSLVESSE